MATRLQSGRGMVALRVASSVVGSASQAALLLLLARDLGPDGFAPFGQFMSLAYLLGLSLGFGFGVQALRLGESAVARVLLGSMVLVRASTSSAVVVGLLVVMSHFWPGQGLLFVAAALLMFNELSADLVLGGLAGQGKQNMGSLVIVLQRVVGSLLPLGLVWVGTSWSVAIIIGQLLVLTLFGGAVRWTCRAPRHPLRVVRDGLPIWLSTTVASLGQLDVTIAQGVGGPQPAGVVAAGSRVSAPLAIVPSAILTVVVPRLARSRESGGDLAGARRRHEVSRMLRMVSLYALGLSMLAPAIAWLLVLVLGPAFESGYWYFTALVVAAALNAGSQVLQAWAYAEDRPGLVTRISVVGIALGLSSLALGLSVWGVAGAALGPLVSQVVVLSQYLLEFRRNATHARHDE